MNGKVVSLPPVPSRRDRFDEAQIIPLPYETPSTESDDKRSRKNGSAFIGEYVFGGFDAKDFNACREMFPPYLSDEVLDWFHHEALCEETTVRMATEADIPTLLQINKVNPLYSKKEDYESVLTSKNEFVIVAERTSKGRTSAVGMIHYYLIWHCPSHKAASRERKSKSRRRDGLLNLVDLEVVPPHKVVYVCTLQVIRKKTHNAYVRRHLEAEPMTGSLLLSLAAMHGVFTGMSHLLCDSTEGATSFYETMFDMRQNPRGERKYIPMQLDLSKLVLQRFWNPVLHASPSVRLYGTLMNQGGCEGSGTMRQRLHLQFSIHGELLSVETWGRPSRHERKSEKLQELQELHVLMNRVDATKVSGDSHGFHVFSLPYEDHKLLWERKEEPAPCSLTLESITVNNREETDDLLLELVALQRELDVVERENEAVLESLEQQSVSAALEMQHLRDTCNDLMAQYEAYLQDKHPERMENVDMEEGIRCDFCNRPLENNMVCCQSCHCCAHPLCACVEEDTDAWLCTACADALQYGVTSGVVFHDDMSTTHPESGVVSEGPFSVVMFSEPMKVEGIEVEEELVLESSNAIIPGEVLDGSVSVKGMGDHPSSNDSVTIESLTDHNGVHALINHATESLMNHTTESMTNHITESTTNHTIESTTNHTTESMTNHTESTTNPPKLNISLPTPINTETCLSADQLDTIRKVRSHMHCALCGYSSGLLFRSAINGLYVHPLCAKRFPSLRLTNHTRPLRALAPPLPVTHPLFSLPYVDLQPNAFPALAGCRFCKKRGWCVRCAVPGCQQAFHILCAAANGLEIAWKPNVCLAKDWDGPLMSPRVRVFCAVHSYNRRGVNVPNVMPEGSWLDPQTATWSDFAVVRWLPESPETCEEASVLPLGRLLSAGDKKDTEKAEAKGRAALERLRVCEVRAVWEMPPAALEYGVCCLKEGTAVGLLSASGLKSDRRRIQEMAAEERLVPQPSGAKEAETVLETSQTDPKPSQEINEFNDITESEGSEESESRKSQSNESFSPKDSKDAQTRRKRTQTPEAVYFPKRACLTELIHEELASESSEPHRRSQRASVIAQPILLPTPRDSRSTHKSKTDTRSRKKGKQPGKRVALLPAPDLPLAAQRLPAVPSLVATKAKLLLQLLASDVFAELFGGLDDHSLSPHSYLEHYFLGVPPTVAEACAHGQGFSDDQLPHIQKKELLGVAALVERIHATRSFEGKLALLRLLVHASLLSVYPPHLCVNTTSRAREMKERSRLGEVKRLCRVCELLAQASMELANLEHFTDDRDRYLQQREQGVECQCLCLREKRSEKGLLVCMRCGVGYHLECLGLRQTDCGDLVLTQCFGYWTLDRGFVCPGCCKSDVFAMSLSMKGVAQIRDSAVIAWQNKLRKKVYVSNR